MPTELERTQMHIQHFPAVGEVVITDRSWYNRAAVESVMGFCTPEQTQRSSIRSPASRRRRSSREST
jgi:polyphosphate kinase 2 (PPK2 family)